MLTRKQNCSIPGDCFNSSVKDGVCCDGLKQSMKISHFAVLSINMFLFVGRHSLDAYYSLKLTNDQE